MRSNFKVVFAKKSTCKSREQCTGPTQKTQIRVYFPFQYNPNVHLVFDSKGITKMFNYLNIHLILLNRY